MAVIIEKPHIKRLNEKGIVIREEYKYKDEIFVRTSDGKENDSVYKAIKTRKEYIYKDKVIYKETKFDKDVTYTIIANKKDQEMNCINCGYNGNINDFYDGCPYCGSHFSIEYSNKRKSVTYAIKEIFNMKTFKFFALIVPIIIFLITLISSNYEIENIIYAIITLPFMFFIGYFLTSLFYTPIIIYRLITYRDLTNDNIYVNRERINNNRLLSDMNFELLTYYYNKELCPSYEDLIDFEILDYVSYKVLKIKNDDYIEVKYKIRKYFFRNEKIKKIESVERIKLMQNKEVIFDDSKSRKCKGCGASVDVLKKHCEYCGNPISSNNHWIINPNFFNKK